MFSACVAAVSDQAGGDAGGVRNSHLARATVRHCQRTRRGAAAAVAVTTAAILALTVVLAVRSR